MTECQSCKTANTHHLCDTCAQQLVLWRPVVGFEGYYEVSDYGQVRSVDRTVQYSDGRVRRYPAQELSATPHGNHCGHLSVSLSRNGRSRGYLVHQLVLRAFVGPPPAGMESLHDNDMPTDNRLLNLSYGTRSDNTRDQVRNGRHNQASKNKCVNGHEFTAENTYRRPSGGRRCRTCQGGYRKAS